MPKAELEEALRGDCEQMRTEKMFFSEPPSLGDTLGELQALEAAPIFPEY